MNKHQLQKLHDQLVRWAEITQKASTPPWKAAVGEDFGQDWLICSIGNSAIDARDHIVTTDRVRASEFLGDAQTDAVFIAEARTAMPILLRIAGAFVQEKLEEARRGEEDGDGEKETDR